MMSLFTNGKARIVRLVIFEFACGIVIMVIGQIIGTLPSQDWLTPAHLKMTCFFLGTLQVLIKGAEMFFSKTVSLFQQYDAGKALDATDKVPAKDTLPTP